MNRLQVWAYHDPGANTRSIINPDEHYLIYFKTIHGEEFTLNCCSYSYGVNASDCLRDVAPEFRLSGSARVPAYFTSAQDGTDHHTLIEEKRFMR